MSEFNSSDLTVLTTEETALILKVSKHWLMHNRQEADGIPYFRLGRRIYYEKKDIIAYVKANKKKILLSKKDDATEGGL